MTPGHRTARTVYMAATPLPPDRCIEYLTLDVSHASQRNASHGRATTPEYFHYPLCTDEVCSNSLNKSSSLQIVCLKCTAEKQKQTGTSFNWKKTALSRAYYQSYRIHAKDMTPRAAAAFQFLQDNNVYYKHFLTEQNKRPDSKSILTLSSFDLFILSNSIESYLL